jgi:hypothetical protein
MGRHSAQNAHGNYERYTAVAKDAARRGEVVEAENFYQHAEHYFRVMKEQGTRSEWDTRDALETRQRAHRPPQTTRRNAIVSFGCGRGLAVAEENTVRHLITIQGLT